MVGDVGRAEIWAADFEDGSIRISGGDGERVPDRWLAVNPKFRAIHLVFFFVLCPLGRLIMPMDSDGQQRSQPRHRPDEKVSTTTNDIPVLE